MSKKVGSRAVDEDKFVLVTHSAIPKSKSFLADLYSYIVQRLPQSVTSQLPEGVENQPNSDSELHARIKQIFGIIIQEVGDVKYEALVQKLENEVRQHIRIEQEMKIYADSVQGKAEEALNKVAQLEKENRQLRQQAKELVREKRVEKEEGAERQSLAKGKRREGSVTRREKTSVQLRKSVSKQEMNLGGRKRSNIHAIGTFRPSLSKLRMM